MEYNTGNLEKYQTKNPLKRKMVERLNRSILGTIGKWACEISAGENKVKVLDAGCGEGFVTGLIHERFPEFEITGLEYTREALDVAEQRYPDVCFKQGDIYKLPYEDGYFDIVICTEVLEHLENPRKALSELNRTSKHFLLLTVPNEPWFRLGNLLVLKNVSRLGDPIDHINHWTFSAFGKMIRNSLPFQVRMSSSFPWTMAEIDKSSGGNGSE